MHVEKLMVMANSVRKLLRRGAQGHAARLVQKLHPGDISQIIQELNDRDQLRIFSLLVKEDLELAAEALTDLGLERGIALLTALSGRETSRLLQELETDDRAAFVSALPEELANQVLDTMRLEESVQVQGLLRYEKETAGRIMTPNVFALQEDISVSEAIYTLQKADEFEMVFYLYVVDDRNHLVGVISLRQLLTVSPSTPLKKIMSSDVISVATDTDQEEVANQVALYDLLAVPVVDHENKLVGVITVDDVIDVIKEEATEDILHLAGSRSRRHCAQYRQELHPEKAPLAGAQSGSGLDGFYGCLPLPGHHCHFAYAGHLSAGRGRDGWKLWNTGSHLDGPKPGSG